MGEGKRFFTLVFERTEAFDKGPNPFKTETIWGTPVGSAVGDLMYESQILEEALEEIDDHKARAALDMLNEYRKEQMGMKK